MSTKLINIFYRGIVRDEKSNEVGALSNAEEVDLLENKDFVRASQIVSTDTMPASTEIFSYCADNADTVFGYGRKTGASDEVRIVSVSTGGADNPGSFATLMTSADTTNKYYVISPIEYHRSSTGDANRLYYLTKDSSTIKLKHCTTAGASETTDGTLTGLDGTNDRVFMRRVYGELFVGNGQYLARVDKDGVFTEKAFTLPNGWDAVDMCEVGASALILARSTTVNANITKCFFWDLSSQTQFDDSFDIPFGGPQWCVKHRETIKILCAINGTANFYEVSAYAGGVPKQLASMQLTNVGIEESTKPISSPRMVAVKDDIIYFGLWKTDKTGIYALGQLDNNKPYALYLAKRFDTTSYATHRPHGLFIQGPNFYAAFDDNGTSDNARCESRNSPSRSSNAVLETVVIDDGDARSLKSLPEVFLITQPLGASESLAAHVATDYGSYTQVYQADGTSMGTTTQTLGMFTPKMAGLKCFKVKVAFTSNGTSSPKLVGVGYTALPQNSTARK